MLGRLLLVDAPAFHQTECPAGPIREQGKRIEKLSKIEHDLIKEVHPQVNEIKEGMEEMIAVVKENSENHPPPVKKKAA